MDVLACAENIKLYDVVQVYDNTVMISCEEYLAVQLHVDCGFSFRSKWRYGNLARVDEGDEYTCPRCGQRLMRRIAKRTYANHYFYITEKSITDTDTIPAKAIPVVMDMRVVGYKEYVDLVMQYKAVQYYGDGYALDMKMTTRKNTFIVRANMSRQVLQIIQRGPNVENYVRDVDLIHDPEWLENTPLWYMRSESDIRHSKKEVMQVVTVWRHEIEKRLRKKLHYQTPSMYAGTSLKDYCGFLFKPLQNIAWRLAAPTAPPYEDETWGSICGDQEATEAFSDVLEKTRRGMEYAAAVCKVFQLPDKPSMRRYLRRTSAFQAVVVKEAMRITDNIDNLMTIASGLGSVRDGIWRSSRSIDFLKILAKRYGDKAVTVLLKDMDSRACRELKDTAYMHSQLTRQDRKAFWEGPRVKVRELHDAIMAMHDRQRIAKQDIPVTPEMAAMQHLVGPYEFYAPKDTHQLIEISSELHNCVKSYARRCINKECIIIGVREQGKIIACIEVMGDEIKQAKLDHNKAAYKNAAVNTSICLWAKRHRLKPCQYDMVPSENISIAI